jgi:hypothetical protein
MQSPAERYSASSRRYDGLPEIAYPLHDREVLVTACGRICMHRKRFNISIVLAGQKLGIKEVDDGIWLVGFLDYDLGYIDLEQKTCNPSTTHSAQGCHPCLRYVAVTYLSGPSSGLTGGGSWIRTFVPLRISASPSWWSRARKPHGAPEGSFSVAGPLVRIHLPPANSIRSRRSAAGADDAAYGRRCPHRPLPRTGWRKRTAIHSKGACYSMTSSARARTDGGAVRPSAWAVLRLITSSTFVDCCTGRSAGLSP